MSNKFARFVCLRSAIICNADIPAKSIIVISQFREMYKDANERVKKLAKTYNNDAPLTERHALKQEMEELKEAINKELSEAGCTKDLNKLQEDFPLTVNIDDISCLRIKTIGFSFIRSKRTFDTAISALHEDEDTTHIYEKTIQDMVRGGLKTFSFTEIILSSGARIFSLEDHEQVTQIISRLAEEIEELNFQNQIRRMAQAQQGGMGGIPPQQQQSPIGPQSRI